ncbi:MAG: hypothetical protein ABJJ90_02765 [Lentilitoribacter sp.]
MLGSAANQSLGAIIFDCPLCSGYYICFQIAGLVGLRCFGMGISACLVRGHQMDLNP